MNVPGVEICVLRPEGDDWRLATRDRRCRTSPTHVCERPATFELNRRLHRQGRTFDTWWGYCDAHAFGRVLFEGVIYHVYWAQPGWVIE